MIPRRESAESAADSRASDRSPPKAYCPLVWLAFSWATIRDQDMVTIGCSTPDEAREVIEISLAQLSRRASTVELQRTRSKTSIDAVTVESSAAGGRGRR